MGIESYGTTNDADETWACDECGQEYDLDHYNDIKAHIWTHTDPPDPAPRSLEFLPVRTDAISIIRLAELIQKSLDESTDARGMIGDRSYFGVRTANLIFQAVPEAVYDDGLERTTNEQIDHGGWEDH